MPFKLSPTINALVKKCVCALPQRLFSLHDLPIFVSLFEYLRIILSLPRPKFTVKNKTTIRHLALDRLKEANFLELGSVSCEICFNRH